MANLVSKGFTGAITSPALQKELFKTMTSVNPACALLCLFIQETGNYMTVAKDMTVNDMIDFLKENEISSSAKKEFIAYAKGRPPFELYFTYEGKPITRSRINNFFNRVSELKPPHLLTVLAFRKTYWWNQYLKAPKKTKIMNYLQVDTVEELAKYFEVPESALTERKQASYKSSILNSDEVERLVFSTTEVLNTIRDNYRNTLLPEDFFYALRKYIDSVDSANNQFSAAIKHLDD